MMCRTPYSLGSRPNRDNRHYLSINNNNHKSRRKRKRTPKSQSRKNKANNKNKGRNKISKNRKIKNKGNHKRKKTIRLNKRDRTNKQRTMLTYNRGSRLYKIWYTGRVGTVCKIYSLLKRRKVEEKRIKYRRLLCSENRTK